MIALTPHQVVAVVDDNVVAVAATTTAAIPAAGQIESQEHGEGLMRQVTWKT